MFKQKFIESLEKFNLLLTDADNIVKGCSPQQIENIENIYGSQLPEFYKIYLGYFGVEAGSYLKGTRAFYKDLVASHSITMGMLDLLKENNISAPDNLFAITLHQGYVGSFFILNELEEDPIIYNYEEGEQIKKQGKFSVIKVNGIEKHISSCNRGLIK